MRVLITGGSGFLSRRIVELLLERGDDVRCLTRSHHPEIEAMGASSFRGDLRSGGDVKRAVDGVEEVFHVAALTRLWGTEREFFEINVAGTRNVIDAALACGAKRLIFTSTPSVTSAGKPVRDGKMDQPYADPNDSAYGASKAEAEQMVRQANSPELATVSLRPRLIIGPRELNVLANFLDRARKGRLPIVGDGSNRVDMTYIDNAAWAHLDAAAALENHQSACAGNAYAISDGDPVLLWRWISEFACANGAPALRQRIPYPAARALGGVLEWVWRAFHMGGEPRLTRQVVTGLGTDQYYDLEPARRDLGYVPRVSSAEGTRATIQWFSEGRADVAYLDGRRVSYEPDVTRQRSRLTRPIPGSTQPGTVDS